ncbi:MAG: InlB B-repeat-containing protein, partial [Bacteroidales bacterium]|nr:InlB B-repeat-containing protein [Bacteroidales bacterium]
GATDMSYMFYNCTGLTKITDSGTASKYLVTSSATDLGSMFRDCSNLTDVSVTKLFDAPNVTSTAYMFANCSNLNYIFLGCTTTASFDMSNVTNIQSMFAGCGKLKAIFVKNDWNTSKVSSYSKCFDGDVYLKGCNGTSYSSSYIGKTYARLDKPGTKGYLSTYKSKITYINCPSTYYSSSYTDFTADKEKTIADPTRNGYVFQGWTGTGLSSYTKKLTLPIYSSGDREYTANWLKDLSYSYYHIQATPSSYTYTGEEISYTITIDGTPLEYGKDYNSSVSTVKNADTYTIAISGITENGYINTRSVSFTINPKTVTVTPDAISKTYGDADPAKITYTYTGFCGSDGFTSAPVFKRATGENVGEYSYSLYTSPKYNSNYYASYDYSNKFTIRPKPITVTPAIISKTYGDVDPEITYSANGLINSDKLSGALSREEGENVGEYSVTIGTLKNANYDISVADVKFSIIPKTLTTPTIVTESEVYPYNGSEIIPAVSLYDNDKLIDPSEYTVTISNNNGIGNGQITITDNPGGNYNVSGKGEFQIVNPNSVCKVTIKSSGLPNAEDKTLFAKKGESIKAPIDFAYEGYTLTGVYKNSGMSQQFTFESDIVESDITLYANWKINSHTLEFVVDGVSVSSVSVDYGTEITAPEQSKTGYTFAWTDNIPATMPDNDLTINGAFTVNVHRLVYKLDGKEYHAEDKEYGKSITALASPAYRDGYVFSGWSKVPATMPDNDVEITGSYSPNKHKVTFITYDEEIQVESAYNVSIASILPEKPGLRFVPKAGSPTKVPDYDITIEGTFEVRTYAIKYVVDYDVYKTVDLYLGDPITVIAAPTKTGYTFSGWSEAPATMPANDIEITGKFTANQHTVTYYIDGEVFKTVTLSYGSRIYPPSAPYKAGLRFAGWGDIPETMPDNDLEIRGTFSSATPVAEVAEEGNGAKVWSYNRTIYIETAPDTKYTIIDLQGRMITTSTTKSSHDEISIAPKGIMIVIINNKSYKVSL